MSRTMPSIQASPASDPEVPAEPMISGIPALIARVIMISVSRFTAAAENMQVPVASGPGPGSVLPASQPIIRAPSAIALSSESARKPEPSMPVAETSGKASMDRILVSLLLVQDSPCRAASKPGLAFDRAAGRNGGHLRDSGRRNEHEYATAAQLPVCAG